MDLRSREACKLASFGLTAPPLEKSIMIVRPYAFVIAAIGFAASAGCGGGAQGISTPGSLPAAQMIEAISHRSPAAIGRPGMLGRSKGTSWARKGAAKQPALLYITNDGNGTVTFYAYRNGNDLSLEGTLTGFSQPGQPCTDKSGNVYIPDFSLGTITEYAHGGTTPLQTINLHGLAATGCAVDLKTGDLAVSTFVDGLVLIYRHGHDRPVEYLPYYIDTPYFVAYDNAGNLFVIGFYFSNVGLAELPKDGDDFTSLTMSGFSITYPGPLQWGGDYLLVGDQGPGPSSVHQTTVSGFTVKNVKTLSFAESVDVTGFWKRGSSDNAKIATADSGSDAALVYSFPSMTVYGTIVDGISASFGATISQAGK